MREAYWKEKAERLEAALQSISFWAEQLSDSPKSFHQQTQRAVDEALAPQDDTLRKLDGGYEMSIHSNPDHTAWARFFKETFPDCGVDEDTMAAWFANAMMAKHDSMVQENPTDTPQPEVLRNVETLAGLAGYRGNTAADYLRRYIERQPAQGEADEALDMFARAAFRGEALSAAEINIGASAICNALASRQRVTDLYHQLLYEVRNKIPDESRHETARRIIRGHENRTAIAESGGE